MREGRGVLRNVPLSTLFCVQHLSLPLQPCYCKGCGDFALSLETLRASCLLLRWLQRMCVTVMFSRTPHAFLGSAARPVLSKGSNTEHISSAGAVPSSSAFCSQVQHYTLRADGESSLRFPLCLHPNCFQDCSKLTEVF